MRDNVTHSENNGILGPISTLVISAFMSFAAIVRLHFIRAPIKAQQKSEYLLRRRGTRTHTLAATSAWEILPGNKSKARTLFAWRRIN